MTNDPRPEERHDGFESLRTLINTGINVIVGLMVAGLGVLVANHFGQKQLTLETARMAEDIKEMRAESKVMYEKVTIMWASGGYSSRSKSLTDENRTN